MSRSCGWCMSYGRTDWEKRVLGGEPVASVVASTPFSEAAARRHIRLHLRPQVLQEMGSPAAAVTLVDLAERLVELSGQAAEVGAYARQTNNGRLALHAIAEERSTLMALMLRLGIDSTDALELYADATALGRALGDMVRSTAIPGLAGELATQLDRAGMTHLGDAIRRIGGTEDQNKEIE